MEHDSREQENRVDPFIVLPKLTLSHKPQTDKFYGKNCSYD